MTKRPISKMGMVILAILVLGVIGAEARQFQRPKTVQPSDIYDRWHEKILTTVF
ncbi:MAG: hypothetical protein AAB037_00280 [Chloroflexota bacterium]